MSCSTSCVLDTCLYCAFVNPPPPKTTQNGRHAEPLMNQRCQLYMHMISEWHVWFQRSILAFGWSAMVIESACSVVTHTKTMGIGTLIAYVTTTTKELCVNVSCDVLHAVCCEPLGINYHEHWRYSCVTLRWWWNIVTGGVWHWNLVPLQRTYAVT